MQKMDMQFIVFNGKLDHPWFRFITDDLYGGLRYENSNRNNVSICHRMWIF